MSISMSFDEAKAAMSVLAQRMEAGGGATGGAVGVDAADAARARDRRRVAPLKQRKLMDGLGGSQLHLRSAYTSSPLASPKTPSRTGGGRVGSAGRQRGRRAKAKPARLDLDKAAGAGARSVPPSPLRTKAGTPKGRLQGKPKAGTPNGRLQSSKTPKKVMSFKFGESRAAVASPSSSAHPSPARSNKKAMGQKYAAKAASASPKPAAGPPSTPTPARQRALRMRAASPSVAPSGYASDASSTDGEGDPTPSAPRNTRMQYLNGGRKRGGPLPGDSCPAKQFLRRASTFSKGLGPGAGKAPGGRRLTVARVEELMALKPQLPGMPDLIKFNDKSDCCLAAVIGENIRKMREAKRVKKLVKKRLSGPIQLSDMASEIVTGLGIKPSQLHHMLRDFSKFSTHPTRENLSLSDMFAIIDEPVNAFAAALWESVLALLHVTSRNVDFSMYVVAVAMLCTLDRDDFLHFLFSSFEGEETGCLTHRELTTMLALATTYSGNISRAAADPFATVGGDPFTLEDFKKFESKNQMLLFPAFRFQSLLRKATISESAWHRYTGVANDIRKGKRECKVASVPKSVGGGGGAKEVPAMFRKKKKM